jgi:hypothetical protein
LGWRGTVAPGEVGWCSTGLEDNEGCHPRWDSWAARADWPAGPTGPNAIERIPLEFKLDLGFCQGFGKLKNEI